MLVLGKKKTAPMSPLRLPIAPKWTKVWAVVVGPLGVGLGVGMVIDGQVGTRVVLAVAAAILLATAPALFFILSDVYSKLKRGMQTGARKVPFFGGLIATLGGFLLTVLGLVIVVVGVSAPFLLGMEAAGITNGSERNALLKAVEKSRTVIRDALKPGPIEPSEKASRPTLESDLFRADYDPKLPTGSVTRGRY
jgi:hypothetical protein